MGKRREHNRRRIRSRHRIHLPRSPPNKHPIRLSDCATNLKHFIVRIHEAERAGLHFDLHLESSPDRYESFAVPKGLPKLNEGQRLAIKTTEHLETEASFEGIIASGYGKGETHIIDQGAYVPIDETVTRRLFNLQGNVFRGNYLMIHWTGNKWLLRKRP